ncbi:medium chain dehydrogenase/reductase family protein [Actinomycetota bacterium]
MDKTQNHRIVVAQRGGPDVLQLVGEDLPEPAPGEVRVKVLTAGVSAYDVMLRSRRFPQFPRPPFTPGEDIVGVVDKLGQGATGVTEGETVAGWSMGRGGGYTEYICMPATELVPVPPGVDPAEAVALVVNYLTAHMALHGTAGVRSGESILVHGAAGGVGSALVQLGKLAGLEVFGTASLPKHEVVSELGATPIDYRNEDFVKRIRTLTGDGVDVVFDPVAGGRQLLRSYRALRKGGRLVMLGMVSSEENGIRAIPFSLLTVGLLKLLPDGKRLPLSGGMEELPKNNALYRETLTEFLDWLAAGKIKPVMAVQVPLADAARAHELLERGTHSGKVVLITDA